ncbi:ribonuclease H-like domain-containing protein [Mycena metata]|uniref:3'-5' exonuclease n=1 Tax=Mycena metata TaxID=1033252 RepID=A0AAD7KJ06_9AGAR|nr:ribonuclease H-like domain-containing protein [Mycena metata]
MSEPTPSPIPVNRPLPPATRYSWQSVRPLPRQLYITDADDADAALSTFNGPCGIDIEWKPNFLKGQPENPIALLQLANSDTILLLHLCHMRQFPKNLQTLLEDPARVKAGVGIQGDAKKLYKDCGIDIRNCVDISLLAKSVDNARWKGKYSDPIGLARLIAAYEDRHLPKDKITRSNWENPLNLEQREYASNDGHAGYTLYTRLQLMVRAMDDPPNPRCYTFDVVRGRLCESSGMTWAPFNPDYDPGPPPPPRPVPASESSSSHTVTSSRPRRRPPSREPVSNSPMRSLLTASDQAGGDQASRVQQKRHRTRPRRIT